ncbi:MAG: putative signal-transduction protein with domain [Frankiales bacterium]|nr:putative signal-transduction protein with domain [Frankiales bacterium]
MRAQVGDQLIVHGVHVDDVNRDGEVLEVHGTDGAPPYLVRWSDNGHESLVFPGTDAVVRPLGERVGEADAR